MRRRIRPALRNKLDPADPAQVRIVRRKLRVTEPELKALVTKTGGSIAAITKEVSVRRGEPAASPPAVPPAAVIEATRRETNLSATPQPDAL